MLLLTEIANWDDIVFPKSEIIITQPNNFPFSVYLDSVRTCAAMPTTTTHAPHVIYFSSCLFLFNFLSISAATRGVFI
jgi:hypothetical protein